MGEIEHLKRVDCFYFSAHSSRPAITDTAVVGNYAEHSNDERVDCNVDSSARYLEKKTLDFSKIPTS